MLVDLPLPNRQSVLGRGYVGANVQVRRGRDRTAYPARLQNRLLLHVHVLLVRQSAHITCDVPLASSICGEQAPSLDRLHQSAQTPRATVARNP